MLRNEKRVCNNMYVCAFLLFPETCSGRLLFQVNIRPIAAILVMINYRASAGPAFICILYAISLPMMWQANVTSIILFIINLK